MRVTIETERLILRPVYPEDAEAIFKWAGDPVVNEFMIYPLHPNSDATREWLKSRDIDDPDECDLGFTLKETGELIGMGGLCYNKENDWWTVGYNLRADKWGNGYVPEAIKGIIDYVDKIRPIRAIQGVYCKQNKKSGRVMEKLGMHFHKATTYSKTDGSVTYDANEYIREFR